MQGPVKIIEKINPDNPHHLRNPVYSRMIFLMTLPFEVTIRKKYVPTGKSERSRVISPSFSRRGRRVVLTGIPSTLVMAICCTSAAGIPPIVINPEVGLG